MTEGLAQPQSQRGTRPVAASVLSGMTMLTTIATTPIQRAALSAPNLSVPRPFDWRERTGCLIQTSKR
jgi:hypothetical protein